MDRLPSSCHTTLGGEVETSKPVPCRQGPTSPTIATIRFFGTSCRLQWIRSLYPAERPDVAQIGIESLADSLCMLSSVHVPHSGKHPSLDRAGLVTVLPRTLDVVRMAIAFEWLLLKDFISTI
jgi:hypothetical protein